MSGEEQLMAAMGFSSFGRPRHERHHTKQVTNAKTDTLPQLMPGTELAGKLGEFSTGSVEDGPHGVVYLLCKENGPTALEAALDQGSSEDDKGFAVSYSELLAELEQEKQKFDKLESSTFLSARAATNAFEKLGRHRFLNRSAMKLVTLDHIFQWTRGLDQGEKSFSFADICGGPGGFSEYLLWRAKQLSGGSNDEDRKTPLVHGYGITLKGAANYCDWRLPSKCMELFDVCYGEDGTGNLYSIANIYNFRDVVRVLHPSGVDLAVADGGFLDARSQSNQVFQCACSKNASKC
ncbi:unnamed protein product [Phytophthora lilii]|uniref:Cap-specific mRNA (nucleoside-2'-O-)-methyltransferase 1 n=1 Tax=Phytophthora lilii TaxID=2077276 RepID=A0A9W6TJX7_9STRA|nr:unnamed protein product [Phytophthora lilii]